ncbi:MAG: PASTA domain-containing protein [Pseudomonadota bacterium]
MLALAPLLYAANVQDHSETGGSCNEFRKQIDVLTKILDNPDLYKAIVRRTQYIDELDSLDEVSRFQLHADQDGDTTLKFDTPEETLIERINGLKDYIGWLGSFQVMAAEKVAEEVLASVTRWQGHIMKAKEKGLTLKGDFKEVSPVYSQLLESRLTAMENLKNLADRSLCFGINKDHLALARLYHETIPNSSGCDSFLKSALLNRIAKQQPPGFSPLLDKETYLKISSSCRHYGESKLITIPNLNKMSLKEAKAILNKKGLTLTAHLEKRAGNPLESGKIYDQLPASGSTFSGEKPVDVWYYGDYKPPPEKKSKQVPYVDIPSTFMGEPFWRATIDYKEVSTKAGRFKRPANGFKVKSEGYREIGFDYGVGIDLKAIWNEDKKDTSRHKYFCNPGANKVSIHKKKWSLYIIVTDGVHKAFASAYYVADSERSRLVMNKGEQEMILAAQKLFDQIQPYADTCK